MNDLHSIPLDMLAIPISTGLLGWLAKITAVLALAWLAHHLMRSMNPRWRILLWRATAIGLIGVAILALREPLLTLAWLPSEHQPIDVAAPPAAIPNNTPTISPSPPPHAWPNSKIQPVEQQVATITTPEHQTVIQTSHEPASSTEPWSLGHWIFLIYSIGLAWGALRAAAGLIHLHRIRRQSTPVPGWIARDAQSLSGRSRKIELRQTDRVKTPCSVGIIRNTILLPNNLCDESHREEIRAALAHEIAHFQGHDLRWNHLLHAISTLLWFHPFAWRMRLAHADACDERCDAEAARQLGDSLGYGRALARLALTVSGRTTPVALSMARRSSVSRRIATLRSELGSRRLSRWQAAIAACLAGCFLLGIGAVALVPSRAEVKATAASEKGAPSENREGSTIRIVDPQGNPITGATVVPWIIDSKEGSGAWGAKSHGDPPVLTTDDDGIVAIPFPPDLQGDQRLPRIDLYCRVSHPEFVPTRSLYDAVPIPPETRDEATTIALQRGAIIEVAALVDGKPLPADDLYALTSTPWNTWASKITRGSDGILQLPRLPAGPELLRIVRLRADAPPLFSDIREMELEIDEEYQLRVTMKPSIQISGTLSENVPRPIQNGRVVAVVRDDISENKVGKPPVHEYILWRDSATINEDGTFTLTGMPSGQLQVIAICDGFVAKTGQRPKFARHGARMYYGRPQVFDMTDSRRNITIEMIPAADASIQVVDTAGSPIEDAIVGFSPNMHWWGGGAQIYGMPTFGTAEAIANPTIMRFPDVEDVPFRAKTNAEGIALVKNLPPGEDNFDVYHKDYEAPIEQINDGGAIYNPFEINLMSGKRTKTTVMLRPKEPERRPKEPATSETDGNAKFEFKKKVRVVDPDGKPIAGATVAPWAIRWQRGHGPWAKKWLGDSEPPVLTTNSKGIAVIPFPRYAISDEKIPPRALTVRVAHPDFAETMYNDVPVTPDKRDEVTTITMHPGAIVDILLEGHKVEQMSADDLYALTSSSSKNWFRKVLVDDRGVLHLPRIPAEEDLIRLVYLPDDGPPVFSKVVRLKFIEGERVAVMFDMERSVSVEGELSDNVPRPVKNGRVVAKVIVHEEDVGNVSWWVWSKVNEDGTFTLDGLPKGNLQAIAICDGYMAESGEPPEFLSDEETPHYDAFDYPQVFKLKGEVTPITVKMTQTGGARFRLLGPNGDPVEGAKVSLWPNVNWWGGGSQVYAEPLIGSTKMIKDPEQAQNAADIFKLFSATTNEDGTAVIKSLPPGNQSYSVQHDTLEMPLSKEDSTYRYDDIKVTAGEVTDVTVRMQPKGTQPLKKRPANPVVPADEESPSRPATSHIPKPQPPKTIPTQAAETELAGVVVDEQGNPLEGVTVDAWTWFNGNETKTDAQGRFSLKPFDPNTHPEVQIQFTKPGYSPSLFPFQKPGTDNWTIVLTQGTWLEGVVTDPTGKPIPDALVRARRGPFQKPGVIYEEVWSETKADEQGRYRLHLEPDTYDVQVRVPELGLTRREGIELAAKGKKELDLQLGPGATFRAVVRDSITNEPVEGIILWKWKEPGIEGISDENGVLEIPDMFEGEFQLTVDAVGENRKTSAVAGEYARWWSPQAVHEWERLNKKSGEFQRNFTFLTFNIKKGGPDVEIFVEPAVTISGRVLDPNGKPVAGATVAPAKTGSGNSITGDTRYSYRNQTDEQGRFKMKLPASGEAEYNLIAHDGEYSQWRTWANGVGEPFKTTPGQTITDVELRLTKPGTVRGRVTDAAERPKAGVKVRAAPLDGHGNRYYVPTARTDKNGKYKLKFVRPGKQRIQIDPFWLDPSEAPEETTQSVEVKAGKNVEGIDFTTGGD